MSRKREQHKKATFELEPDGFSIHTFELSTKLTQYEYHQIKNTLYEEQKNRPSKGPVWIYRESSGKHTCCKYADHGIRISIEHNENGAEHSTYFVRMIVNPRKLIDPESPYIGILPPTKDSIKDLTKAFHKLFQDTVFENDIDSYQVRRVDLCTNICCDNKKIFRELVRVLRKLPTPPKYERKLYKDKDKQKANRYNKHYLRFGCGTHELIIYDKTYQIAENKLMVGYEKLSEGVLRFEVHYEREYLRQIEKKKNIDDATDLLYMLMQESQKRMIKHFSHCFSDSEFCRFEELEHRIGESSYKQKTKEAMLALARQLQRVQSVDKALIKSKSAGIDTENLLDKFEALNVSPIPLWKSFCAKSIPGPSVLLRKVAEGKIEVEYIVIKSK